jgi:hypothetical protein
MALCCDFLIGDEMGIFKLEDGRIVDEFMLGQEPYVYSDAIVMEEETYNKYTEQELNSMKENRYKNWLRIVKTIDQENSNG